MAHLSLYHDDDFAKTAVPRPLPQRKPTADFELFGPSDSDDSFYHPAIESIRPWDSSYGSLDSHDHDLLGAEPSEHSPSLLPVPDLIPDSPASPAMSYIPNPSLRPEFRSSSAPIPDQRGMRAAAPLAQSFSEVYSPRGAHPPLGQAQYPSSTAGMGQLRPSHTGQGALSTTAGDPSGSVQPGQLSSDYQAAWEKLQYVNNPLPYAPSYTVQPHHTQPHYGSAYLGSPPLFSSPSQPHRQPAYASPHSQMPPPVSADDFRKTVSPQEAFLDYDDVDHALHSNALFHSSYGVGVGAGRGASLFAPLPSTTPSFSGAAVAVSPRSTPDELLRRRSSAANASPPARSNVDRASSLPPPTQPSTTTAVRYGSRFAVPQNAVSWVDDGGEEEEEEEEPEEPHAVAPSGRGAGKKPLSRRILASNVPGDKAPSGSDPESAAQAASVALAGKRLPSGNAFSTTAPFDVPIHHSRQTQLSELSFPTSSTSPSISVETRSTNAAAADHASTAALPKEEEEEEEEEESVPGDHESEASDDTDEYVPATTAPSTGGGRVSSSRRKRSRPASHADDFVSDVSEEDDDDEGAAEPGRSSAPTRRKANAQPPNKRRRRAPAPSSASTLSSPNAIRCDHSNGDGTVCGVIFRRPYDLARHKETIHGDGGKVKKEWVCDECHGSFSRKDALIRHARIRSHEAFST